MSQISHLPGSSQLAHQQYRHRPPAAAGILFVGSSSASLSAAIDPAQVWGVKSRMRWWLGRVQAARWQPSLWRSGAGPSTWWRPASSRTRPPRRALGHMRWCGKIIQPCRRTAGDDASLRTRCCQRLSQSLCTQPARCMSLWQLLHRLTSTLSGHPAAHSRPCQPVVPARCWSAGPRFKLLHQPSCKLTCSVLVVQTDRQQAWHRGARHHRPRPGAAPQGTLRWRIRPGALARAEQATMLRC